ncbi:MAG: hypothetical protein WBD87_09720 [Candidatus Acidiferrales bacterium]
MPQDQPVQIVVTPELAEVLASRRQARNAQLTAAGQPPVQDESPFISSADLEKENARAAQKPRRTRITPAAKAKIDARCKSIPGFERHSRKCCICRHPHVDAIEEIYLNWYSGRDICAFFHLNDPDIVYRHGHAAGLDVLRRQNVRAVIERFIEQWPRIKVSSSTIIRSIRALSCLDDKGHWADLPSTHILLSGQPLPAEAATSPTAVPVLGSATISSHPPKPIGRAAKDPSPPVRHSPRATAR